jgi:hypothetical protein
MWDAHTRMRRYWRSLRRDPDVARSACDGEVDDFLNDPLCTDEKENQMFLTYKELSGAVAKSYVYEEGLPNI